MNGNASEMLSKRLKHCVCINFDIEVVIQKYSYKSTHTEVLIQKCSYITTHTEVLIQKY